MAKRKKKKFRPFKALISFAFVFVVLFAAYVAFKSGSDLSWENIERTVRNIFAGVGYTDSFEYGSSENALFADLSGGLLKLTESEVTAYSVSGEEMYSENLRLERPSLHASNGRAAVYGVGGSEVRVFDRAGLIYELNTDEKVISVSISAGGRLALCTKESGWSGSVTAYDISGTAVYKWYCASGYPSVAAVSADGSEMAVLIIGSEGSNIVFLSFDSETEKARFKLDGKLILDIRFMDNGNLSAVTETGLIMVKPNGESAGTLEFEERYLYSYSLESGDINVLAAADFIGANMSIVTTGETGEKIGELESEFNVISISACKNRLAVLYKNTAVIYKKDMSPEVTLVLSEPAMSVLMRSDGTALIMGSHSANILKP